jgi:stage V sporulation protein G
MPAKKRKDGTYKDIAHPLNADMRERLERTVLAEYERAARNTMPRRSVEPQHAAFE